MSIFRSLVDDVRGSLGAASEGIGGGFRAVIDGFASANQLPRVGGGGNRPPPAIPGNWSAPPRVGGFGGGGIRDIFNQRFGGLGGGYMPPTVGGFGPSSVGGFGPMGGGYRPPSLGVPKAPTKPDTKGGTGNTAGWGDGSGDPGTAKWRAFIEEAAVANGIDDPDIIQAIMMLESGGNERALSPAGAQGLMQVMPFHWKAGEDPWDPRTNIMKGASILADNYRRYGNWDSAVAAYLGAVDANGNPTTAADAHGTNGFTYIQKFRENLAKLKANSKPRPGSTGAAGRGVVSLFGGTMPPVTQGFGRTDFSSGAGADIYDFGNQFGLDGDEHTGWDIGAAVGTNFYMPEGLSGVVTIAGRGPGGGYYYTDEQLGPGDGRGELRILLDNGMELILGHNSAIGVKVGQRVTAGMLLGQTGWANGAHLHLEVRRRDPSTPSKWRIIDPAELFGGAR